MKIATLNIDWGGKAKSEIHFKKIEDFLNNIDLDILVLKEAIPLNLEKYPFHYSTIQLPTEAVFQGINYGEYLKSTPAFRVLIYSKFKAKAIMPVNDFHTSLALMLDTPIGDFILYSTIIGTQFRKKPYAKLELDSCVDDCRSLSEMSKFFLLVGDLNTSFKNGEEMYCINSITTQALLDLCNELGLTIVTSDLPYNIDHIIVSESLQKMFIYTNTFVDKGVLSDHKGVIVDFSQL